MIFLKKNYRTLLTSIIKLNKLKSISLIKNEYIE